MSIWAHAQEKVAILVGTEAGNLHDMCIIHMSCKFPGSVDTNEHAQRRFCICNVNSG